MPNGRDTRRGRRLKKLRLARGLTQIELADRTDYTQEYLSRVENGNKPVTPALLVAVAKAIAWKFERVRDRVYGLRSGESAT